MNRPLVRWTIGRVQKNGFDVLLESIRCFKIIYPEFDRIVCYNNLETNKVDKLKKIVNVYKQVPNPNLIVSESGWKLVPPRLRLKSHELWLDNDVVICEKIPLIDEWLVGTTSIITEGKFGVYGDYAKYVKNNYKLCAGVFGFPPNFDFSLAIEKHTNKLVKSFDEQGVTAAIVSSFDDFICIPMKEIAILDCFTNKFKYNKGMHFVGVNRGEDFMWKEYLKYKLKKRKLL